MNTASIKKYAPKAGKDFIADVTRQAAKVGGHGRRELLLAQCHARLVGQQVRPALM